MLIFDSPESLVLNEARMNNLESLHLPLENKRVLDVGCGVGHLAQFFVKRNCGVTCIDGRAENVNELKRRYPELSAWCVDVERTWDNWLGGFDIVFCYGLLYHLAEPWRVISNLAEASKELILLETLVTDAIMPILQLEKENSGAKDQSLGGIGGRPSPSYVVWALQNVGFSHVYTPKELPKHPDFIFERRNDMAMHQDGHRLRMIFVGSKHRIKNDALLEMA